jgi:hypothetical protein
MASASSSVNISGGSSLTRTGDPGLQEAARGVLSKVTLVVPDPLRDYLTTAPVYVSKSGAPAMLYLTNPTDYR